MSELKEAIEKAWSVAQQSPELNMSNYNSDDVEKLNNSMTEVFSLLDIAIDLIREKEE